MIFLQLRLRHAQGLGFEDGAATLTYIAANYIAQAVRWFPAAPVRWIVCGGGRRNATLMRMIWEQVNQPGANSVSVDVVESVGWDGDFIEAQAFAVLAARHVRGLPISFPGTTGVSQAMCGGRRFDPS